MEDETTILEIKVVKHPGHGFTYNLGFVKVSLRTPRQVMTCVLEDTLRALDVLLTGKALSEPLDEFIDKILEAQGIDPNDEPINYC